MEMKASFSEAWSEMVNKLGDWFDALIMNLPNILIAILVFAICYIISKYVSRWVRSLLDRSSLQNSIKNLLSKLTAVAIILVGLFLVLGILNLSKTLNTILAGAGVAGLAVGLALQGALANTYSGIVLSFGKHIKFGDWGSLNDIEGSVHQEGITIEGEVVDIDLRAVTLKQPDNNLVYIPNKLVVENPIKNFSTTAQSRVILECGVAYGSDLREVRSIVIETLVKHFDSLNQKEDLGFENDTVQSIKEDIIFLFTEFGGSSINFEARFEIDSTSALEVAQAKTEAMILVKERFDKEGISIPFPIRTLDLPETTLKALSPKEI